MKASATIVKAASPRQFDGVRPLVGVSSCLLGERVRYDGGHKHDRWITDTLGELVQFVAVCPEIEIGLGAPREPIHIVGDGETLRLVGKESGRDLTAVMRAYARRRVDEISRLDLSGYILKSGSPSCGIEGGLFAAELMKRLPLVAVEDESRLQDPALREEFIARVFAHHRAKPR